MEIDLKTIEATTRCRRGYDCIFNGNKPLCEVTQFLACQVYFVNCAPGSSCNYRVAFGEGFFCTCPVRQEIYNRYKK